MINIQQHMSCVTFRRYRKVWNLKNWGMGKLKLWETIQTGDDTEGKVHVTLSVW